MVDDRVAVEDLGEIADVDDVRPRSWPRLRQVDVDDLARLQPQVNVVPRTRLDEIDQRLAVLEGIDHRRGEFRLARDIAHDGGQAGLAAVAMHGERLPEREARARGLRHEDREFQGAVGQEGDDRRRRARDLADAPDDVGDVAVGRRDQLALPEPPLSRIERCLRLGGLVLRRGDLLRARRQFGDREIGA